MLELNVKQSGICGREFDVVYRKSRSGKVLKRVHEHYLRNDVTCHYIKCGKCSKLKDKELNDLQDIISTTCSFNHAIILDSTSIVRFHHLFDTGRFKNIIITQSVWTDVKNSNLPAYKTINAMCYENKIRDSVVFMDGLHYLTHTKSVIGEVREEKLDRSLVMVAKFYKEHWSNYGIEPILICASEDKRDKLKLEFSSTLSMEDYINGMEDNKDLLNKITLYNLEAKNRGKPLFPQHLSLDVIQNGIRSGKFRKAVFQVSRENYVEASVRIDDNTSWFIQGKINGNRAISGDTVAVELLPEEEWTCPEKLIRLRDLEEREDKNEINKDEESVDDTELTGSRSNVMVVRADDRMPSARVVGIIKRNWRQYCGMILKPAISDANRVLFAAAERLIPRIRIETRQVDQLLGKRIIVAIDNWPRDSRYPVGHYVRTIGVAGGREIENEVLLLEHDIPHHHFSEAVLRCLPDLPWLPCEQPSRKDLRSLIICSVDPPGCTDIDDALHCRPLPSGTYEVGVHIADVTHFVRPGTALDDEAAFRGTTVYLCDRRIDMLPELLSSNLCSLRKNVDRFAFSVIWTLTASADIIDVRFHKSVIRSRGALTYEMAQDRIDNPDLNDDVTKCLRNLFMLSRHLRNKRQGNGALNLASSELRFNIDEATKEPISVQAKEHLDTNSMVEEFMLLANISVAEKICADFPDCAVLHRHPVPIAESYKSLIKISSSFGLNINVESGKALSESLDKAVDPSDPAINTLLRMFTTRCMTQAVYFSSGSLPTDQYVHFGLAAPIYTHFTSPIRRYADVMVHRLLAAAIEADTTFPSMLKCDNIANLTNNLNYRHRQAQHASRASVLLNTMLYFKGRNEFLDAYIMGIRKNGIQVLFFY